MGVIFTHSDADAKRALTIKGTTAKFSMDYFEGRRIDAIIKDTISGNLYKIHIKFPLRSADKDPHKERSAHITITQLNGQFRFMERLKDFSLNQNHITFKYYHYINNKGFPMIGKISHTVGKEAYIGFKTMGRR